ncbi:hypothetical protein [Glutamicibacter arilaitensis]|uniref:hypothetical protein n=1 Tax=Glutamicibacter arilaitensis TaxID=256701 RepID=UPI003FD6023C
MTLRITRLLAALSAPALALTLASCGSSSKYETLDDLTTAIENAGYSCEEPFIDPDHPGETQMGCGWSGGVIWYDTAKAEAESYASLAEIYEQVGVPLYSVRGEKFHIIGPNSEMKKISDSIDIQMSIDGAK